MTSPDPRLTGKVETEFDAELCGAPGTTANPSGCGVAAEVERERVLGEGPLLPAPLFVDAELAAERRAVSAETASEDAGGIPVWPS